ncbi:MAG TPA: threonine ammonia-lyase, biosynthetic [Chromatiales bacterium]|nr:threonine ammonia-lyase, biosynthetic [Chromatiales bacterium]
MADYLKATLKARVYDVAVETPLELARRLSARMDNTVLFKREDLQPVFSFKIRGAYNKLMNLPVEELGRGVICSSAGNHAQGVALAARELGVRAVVVMPKATPRIKVEAVDGYGAETILHGDDYDAAYEHALQLAAEQGLSFVHPFDDPDVIAGQGTIGMEILRQHNGPPDAIFVPVGGGGLISGIAAYTKSLFPEIRVIGVEPKDSASMHAALGAGRPVTLDRVGIFADGVAVRRVGDETFRLCRQYVDEILLVGTDELCAAIQDIFEDTRTIVEPAGALAVAGMKRYVESTGSRNLSFVTVNCGANLNFDRLRYIAERAALGENRETLLAVEIPEQKGSFLEFCSALGARNITEFNYRYSGPETAHIFVGVELGGGANEAVAVLDQLRTAGYEPVDLSGNEFAKLHVRYLVGGPAPGLTDERVYRFEFPERPGALLKFLQAIGSRWNISLFHYRNHGSDYGRVLAGIQVPDSEQQDFSQHLKELGYPFRDETDNPAYRMFLT